jgi:hypothetical protein
MKGRVSAQVQSRDWLDRLSRVAEALTPDGIRAVSELCEKILIGFTVLAILAYSLSGLSSSGKSFIPFLILLKLLSDSKRQGRDGR